MYIETNINSVKVIFGILTPEVRKSDVAKNVAKNVAKSLTWRQRRIIALISKIHKPQERK